MDGAGHSSVICAVNTVSYMGDLVVGTSYFLSSNTGTKTLIGAEVDGTDLIGFYQGFVYNLQIYNIIKDTSLISSSQCTESCLSCPTTLTCIPNCPFQKY